MEVSHSKEGETFRLFVGKFLVFVVLLYLFWFCLICPPERSKLIRDGLQLIELFVEERRKKGTLRRIVYKELIAILKARRSNDKSHIVDQCKLHDGAHQQKPNAERFIVALEGWLQNAPVRRVVDAVASLDVLIFHLPPLRFILFSNHRWKDEFFFIGFACVINKKGTPFFTVTLSLRVLGHIKDIHVYFWVLTLIVIKALTAIVGPFQARLIFESRRLVDAASAL